MGVRVEAVEVGGSGSWCSGGIVWWSMNDHGVSAQHGRFVPPPNGDGSPPSVWGVFVDKTHNVILAGDVRSGLWIVKPGHLGTL